MTDNTMEAINTVLGLVVWGSLIACALMLGG